MFFHSGQCPVSYFMIILKITYLLVGFSRTARATLRAEPLQRRTIATPLYWTSTEFTAAQHMRIYNFAKFDRLVILVMQEIICSFVFKRSWRSWWHFAGISHGNNFFCGSILFCCLVFYYFIVSKRVVFPTLTNFSMCSLKMTNGLNNSFVESILLHQLHIKNIKRNENH